MIFRMTRKYFVIHTFIFILCITAVFCRCNVQAKADIMPIISDDANLITEEEEAYLYETMLPICQYGVPLMWTTYEDGEFKQLSKQFFIDQNIDEKSWILFMINMGTKQIAIYAEGDLYKTITSEVASKITDSVYQLAGSGQYNECASNTFTQILGFLTNQSKNAVVQRNSEREPILFRNIDWGVTYPEVRSAFNGLLYETLVNGKFFTSEEVEYDLFDDKNAIYYDERVASSDYERESTLLGEPTNFTGFKVAGYEVKEMQLKFAAIPDEDGFIINDDDHTYFYFARYVFAPKDVSYDKAAVDLKNKLMALYGDPDDYYENGALFRFDKYTIWYGDEDTVLVLYIYEPYDIYGNNHVEKIEIRYGTLKGNEKLKVAYDAARKTRERDTSTDFDGL